MTRAIRRSRRALRGVSATVLGALLGLAAGCGNASGRGADRVVEHGDEERGRTAIAAFGCGSCHSIPGVRGAAGMVGPSLEHWADRRIIAGQLPNEPAGLIAWLMVPQSIEPGTAMPNMGVTDGQARDMAAYLYTLH